MVYHENCSAQRLKLVKVYSDTCHRSNFLACLIASLNKSDPKATDRLLPILRIYGTRFLHFVVLKAIICNFQQELRIWRMMTFCILHFRICSVSSFILLWENKPNVMRIRLMEKRCNNRSNNILIKLNKFGQK